MEAEDPSDGECPFSGPVFVLTYKPPDPAVTFLTGDIMEAAAMALDAAGGRTSKSSVLTWPVSACSGGRWTRSWCL